MEDRLLVNSWKIFIYLNLSFEQMNINGTYYHPTFLYESLWSLLGFVGLCPHRHYTEPKTAFASRRSRFELRFVVLSGSVLH